MKVQTSLNHQTRAKEALQCLYARAREYGYSQVELFKQENEIFSRLIKCPRHIKAFARGYSSALWDHMFRFDLEFCYKLPNGDIYSTHKKSIYHKHTREMPAETFLNLPSTHRWITANKDYGQWA